MEDKKCTSFNISTFTIIKIILVFILFYFLYLIREILAILFVSLILASAVDPWVDWMEKRKIPRGAGILVIYLVMFAVVGGVVGLIIPPIIEQTNDLIESFPRIFEKIVSAFSILKEYSIKHGLLDEIRNSFGSLSDNLQGAAGGFFSTVSGIFGGIFTFFLVLVITFYMTVEENALKKIVWSVAPAQHQVYIMKLVNRMQKKVGLWLRGQLILSLIIFLLTYCALLLLDVKYALVLALIAGLTEFVPYLGPILAVFVAIVYYIIQLVENNIIVPKLMQKVVGLNPIVSIAVLMIGFKVAGIVGAILSIPVATAVNVFVKDIFEQRAGEMDKTDL